MPYRLYGKRDFDKNFKALDRKGRRVAQLSDAMLFIDKKFADDFLEKVMTQGKIYNGAIFEVRKTDK